MTINNLVFQSGIANVVHAIEVEADADGSIIEYCEFLSGTTDAFEFVDCIEVAALADDLIIRYNKATETTAGAASWLDIAAGVLDNLSVYGNEVYGDYSVSVVNATARAHTVGYYGFNVTSNINAADYNWFFNAAATGVLEFNRMFSVDEASTLDPGSLSCFGNTVTTAVDKSGMPIPVHDTGLTQLNATTITAINSGLTGVGFRVTCEANAGGASKVTAVGLAGFGNDYFNTGWSMIVILDADGVGTAPEGEIRDIEDYISTTGVFTVDDDFSANITTGDGIYVRRNEDLNFHDVTLARTSGEIWYCDDGGSNGDGKTWQTAKTTLKAAEALMSAGDICYIGANHDEEVATADTLTLNVAGTSFIGLGEGDARPLITITDDGTLMTIDNAGIALKNVRLQAGVTACDIAIRVEDAAIGCVIENVAFIDGEASATDEFVDGISVDALASYLTVRNCTWFSADVTGHTNTFVNLDEATIAGATVEGCTVFGMFAEAPIWSDAVPTNINILDNVITNLTTGQLCIEFQDAATGVIADNKLAGDTYGAILDPGSAKTYGNTQTIAINAGAIDVPLVAGRTYAISVAKEDGDLDIFDVAGGPILITSFTGLITELVAGAAEVTTITFDGVDDFEFSTGVDVTGWVKGSRIVFSEANPAVLTQLALTTSGSGQIMKPWFCPIGMIEQTDDADNVQNGAWVWYMTFVPLVDNVTVIAQ